MAQAHPSHAGRHRRVACTADGIAWAHPAHYLSSFRASRKRILRISRALRSHHLSATCASLEETPHLLKARGTAIWRGSCSPCHSTCCGAHPSLSVGPVPAEVTPAIAHSWTRGCLHLALESPRCSRAASSSSVRTGLTSGHGSCAAAANPWRRGHGGSPQRSNLASLASFDLKSFARARLWRGRLVSPVYSASCRQSVLQRFGDVRLGDHRHAFEIGNRARHAQHAHDGARAEVVPRDAFGQRGAHRGTMPAR